jgi:hypothetical protein
LLRFAGGVNRLYTENPGARPGSPVAFTERGADQRGGSGGIHGHLVLPQADDPPSERLEFGSLPPIAADVREQLLRPELAASAGTHVVIWTAVPLAPVHEHGDTG